MSAKTKIVVLHMKELIYTGIFIALGIFFIILLCILFLPNNKKQNTPDTDAVETNYIPGIYTSSLVLSDTIIDVEVVVDAHSIQSVRIVNLDDAVTTMYPLIEPAIDSIATQLVESQSIDAITYSDDSKYTTMVLLNAIKNALSKASISFDIEEY